MSDCSELDDTLNTYGAFNGYPNGTIKDWMGNTHFKMRRLENVATEFAQHILTYNMTSVMNIFGIPALIQAMRV